MNTRSEEPLKGWKEIARYVGMSVRTAQRKADTHALPVRRPRHAGPKEPVFALKSELDQWKLRSVSGGVEAPQSQRIASPQAAELAQPVLKHILSMGDLPKLYRKNYFMRFDLHSFHGGIVAYIDCEYQVCNASAEAQPFVHEVTVDESDHGYLERMALTLGKRSIYDLKRPPISERHRAWVAYRGPEQQIKPTKDNGAYLFRASWVIHRAASDIWYNHMLLPTIGVRIETHASAAFEITESFSKTGLVMKGEHCDIQWRRRTER